MATLEELAAEIETLRGQVQVLQDREEIRGVVKAYARNLDARDMEAFSLLFARNGSWVGRSGTFTGHKEIQSTLGDSLESNVSANGPTLYHLNSDPAIEIDGDRATAFTFWMHVRRNEKDSPTLPTLGSYNDVFVREDGRWRFLERKVSVLMAS
jgi:uncharacterized protein (TIGR02246 family)